jgi:cobalamin biosynthesis Mg chelatase CobN
VYQQISETFVLDAAMRDRLATLNPKASVRMANRLLEASTAPTGRPTRTPSRRFARRATNSKIDLRASCRR